MVVVYVLVYEPVVATGPTPDKVHEVLLVDDQLRVDAPPLAIESGDAERVAVGAAVTTVTVVLWLAVPPAPVHVRV